MTIDRTVDRIEKIAIAGAFASIAFMIGVVTGSKVARDRMAETGEPTCMRSDTMPPDTIVKYAGGARIELIFIVAECRQYGVVIPINR